MAGASYNGYPWWWRVKILEALDREREQGRTYLQDRCDICEDRAAVLHSEDYSLPYTFSPPQTYSLCRPCHRRVHRRFKEPPEMWWLWLEHLKAGGYGAEFSEMYPVRSRDQLVQLIALGRFGLGGEIRQRRLQGDEWWLRLSLDPLTQIAPWGRPRPLRQHPSRLEYGSALECIGLTRLQVIVFQTHAAMPNSSVSMNALASGLKDVIGLISPGNMYREVGRALSAQMDWKPDTFRNGYPNWLTVLAECWKPVGGDVEWVLLPVLQQLFRGQSDCHSRAAHLSY